MKKGYWKKGLSVLTSVAMLIGILPITGVRATAYAEETEGMTGDGAAEESAKTIHLGTDMLRNPAVPKEAASAWSGDYVYFGAYDGNPMKYRVLDAGTTAFGEEETVLLDCDMILQNYHFHDTADQNMWTGSDLYQYLNSRDAYLQDGFLNGFFSARERDSIAESRKNAAGDKDGSGWEGVLDFAPLNGEKIFVLDAAELTNSRYGYIDETGTAAARTKKNGDGTAKDWWMRSTVGSLSGVAGFVSAEGNIGNLYRMSETDGKGISPALNVKAADILFVNSDKAAKKAEGLARPENAAEDAAWTLTLIDDTYSVKQDEDIIRFVTENETKYRIPYRVGAKAQDNDGMPDQLSMMITDKEYDASDAQILYYGKVADITDFTATGSESGGANGSEIDGVVEIVLPEETSDEYHYYFLAEQVNGEHLTDYASVPEEIDFAKAKTAITHISVNDITPAEGGKQMDIEAVCDTKGVATTMPAVRWTPSDEEKAKFHTAYTAQLTLEAEEGYVFYEEVTAEIDGREAAVVTPHETGTTRTIVSQEYTTAKAKLLEIGQIQNVAADNGTPLAAILELLPKTVAIVTEDEEIGTANLTWNTAELETGYDASLMTGQSFTVPGTVVCPPEIDTDQKDLNVSIVVEAVAATRVRTPWANPGSGTYEENQLVELGCDTAGAAIYYTTDGSMPSASNGMRYTGPIAVGGIKGQAVETKIRAVAVYPDLSDSFIAEFVYTVKIPTTVRIVVTGEAAKHLVCDGEYDGSNDEADEDEDGEDADDEEDDADGSDDDYEESGSGEGTITQIVPGGDEMEEVTFEAQDGYCIPKECQIYINNVPFKLTAPVEEEDPDDGEGDDADDEDDDSDDGDDDSDDGDDDSDDGDDDSDDEYGDAGGDEAEQYEFFGIVIQEDEHQRLVISGAPTQDTAITLFSMGIHDGGAGVVEEPPTCGAEGDMSYHCNTCGETWSEPIEPTGLHAYGYVDRVPPTFEEEGVMEHYECSVCGMYFTEENAETEVEWEDLLIPRLVPEDSKPELPPSTGNVIVASEPVVLPTIGEEPEMVIGNAFSSKWVTSEEIDESILPEMMEPVESGSTYNTLYWKEVSGADGYLVYGAECGTNQNVVKKIKEIKNSYTTSYKHKKLNKDTWYRYKIVPYKLENGKRVALGKTLEMFAVTATKSGKYANPTAVKLSKSKITVKKGKSATVSAQVLMPKNKKTKKYTSEIRWVSSDTKIVKVDKKGKITAKKKGTCYIYAFTQNGMSKRVKVVVK